MRSLSGSLFEKLDDLSLIKKLDDLSLDPSEIQQVIISSMETIKI